MARETISSRLTNRFFRREMPRRNFRGDVVEFEDVIGKLLGGTSSSAFAGTRTGRVEPESPNRQPPNAALPDGLPDPE